MATTFSMFDTTPSGAVAAIKSAILASTDWSNPAGDRVTCTTTRGAAMVVDLADAAATALRLQLGVYRTTGLADKIVRYMYWRPAGGATTDTLHCTVSAGKEHLFVTVEGPRVGEANPYSAGSYRPVFFLCDLVPYFPADTIAAVVCGGTADVNAPITSASSQVYVSRNATDTASWVVGSLETLQPTRGQATNPLYRYSGQSLVGSTRYVRPYVVFEDTAGMRGRLARFFHMGWNIMGTVSDFPVPMFTRITVGGATYIGVPVHRSASSTAVSPFAQGGSIDGTDGSPVIAVPYA
jgi:hypothetical protein